MIFNVEETNSEAFMNSRSFIVGIILIAVGALLIADNLGWIWIRWEDFWEFWYLWPWLMIIGGALFWIGWFKNRQEIGLLMPGTILLVYGLLFWYNVQYGWWHMGASNLWAFFLIGPGLGFLIMYLLGKRDRGLLVPAGILIVLGVIFLTGWSNISLLWPIILIVIGIRLILKHREKQN
jgi:hypothetical protein